MFQKLSHEDSAMDLFYRRIGHENSILEKNMINFTFQQVSPILAQISKYEAFCSMCIGKLLLQKHLKINLNVIVHFNVSSAQPIIIIYPKNLAIRRNWKTNSSIAIYVLFQLIN